MSARRDRIITLLNEGKSHADIASLTGESRAYIARVDRQMKRERLLAIIKAIAGETGKVKMFLLPGEEGQEDGMLIVPAGPNGEIDSLIKCLIKSSKF